MLFQGQRVVQRGVQKHHRVVVIAHRVPLDGIEDFVAAKRAEGCGIDVRVAMLLAGGLHAAGVPLSLFHLVALVLAAGLGLDYALFFEHASDDEADQRRTLHALLVCSLSTLLVFALLATSSLPVLRAIGITVSAGVVLNFFLALMLTRPEAGR